MRTVLEQLRSWVQEHRIASIGIAVIVVFLGLAVLSLATIIVGGGPISSMNAQQSLARSDGYAEAGGGGGVSADLGRPTKDTAPRPDEPSSGAFVEVQEARFDITSDDAEDGAARMRTIAGRHNGYIEESRKHESSLYRTIDLTVRVPDSQFDTVVDQIKDEYDVDSFNVKNHRVSTQREIDELTILNETLADYERMRTEINGMNTDEEKINLLMQLTEKQLEVKEKQQRYQRQLSDKQQRGDEATIQVELRERKNVEIWPENLQNRFMSNIKDMLNQVTDIVLGTLTQAVVLFFKAIQAVIYLVVIALPFLLAYRIGQRVHEEYWDTAE